MKQRADSIEKQVRSSRAYSGWVKRNKHIACMTCNTDEDLDLHHMLELGALIRKYMKRLAYDEDVTREVKNLHANDQLPHMTLCRECHEQGHKTSKLPDNKPIPTGQLAAEPWCVIPHPIGIPLAPSRSHYPVGALGFIALQTLFGIGYHLLNDQFEDRICKVNYRRFAELIGKKPTTSFAKLLDGALRDLRLADMVAGHIRYGSMFEIHLTKDYLDKIRDNYWFVSINDVASKSMLSLSIKHILNTQKNRYYRISLEKLCIRTGLSCKNPSVARKYIRDAVKHISWVTVKIEGNNCDFTKKRHKYAPIHSLSEMLEDTLSRNR